MPKNKKRISLKTVLIYCEGYCEYAFSLYIKELFHKRGSGFTVSIENGYGGSPVKTVERSINQDGYEKKYVWTDTELQAMTMTEKYKNSKRKNEIFTSNSRITRRQMKSF